MSLFSEDAMELQALRAGWKEKQEIIKKQAAELDAARAEIERLENQVQARDAELWGRTQKILQLEQQLAAEQAYSAKLREALLTCRSTTRIGEGDDPDTEYYFSHYDVCTALTIPHDDSALMEWGARLLRKLAEQCYQPGSYMHDNLMAHAEQLRSGDWKP